MKKFTYTEKKDTRSGFGAGLVELGRKNPNVVALEKYLKEKVRRMNLKSFRY